MRTSYFGKLKHLSCAIVIGMAGMQTASAGIVFSQTQPAPGTVSNVRFLAANGAVFQGTTVTGTVGPRNDRYFIDFTSSEPLTAVVPDTPPTVRASDGTLQDLLINVQNGAFTTFYLNIRAQSGGNPANRYADILVTGFGGESETFRLNFLPGANANNIFRVDATGDTLLKYVSITSAIAITEVRQPRIGGLQAAPVPEPATLLSLGIGAAALLAAGRRKRTVAAS